ncbi:MAG: chromosomal replication initiator protein DnaA [Proteobacteria bacterium]|nr:chromosomal replication initiator protein DnaA [Pseudomonadota bacterium]MBU1685782.1 chromosomal replication initiator protein DnaA [Pseudomonadota bacterium]
MNWEKIKEKVTEHLLPGTISLWVEPLECLRDDQDCLELVGPDRFFCSWVRENLQPLFLRCLTELGSPETEILFKVAGEDPARPLLPGGEETPQLRLPCIPKKIKATVRALHPRFTFDEFMVGESNLMAKSACEALANDDPSLGRSVFVQSGTGLGKSHLTHAVAHKIMSESPGTRLHYVTAQQLTAEMVRSIQSKTMEDFKEKYHNHCDVLLVEDVHSLAGRSKTQEELTATLDALMKKDKRIIFTSKMSPREIPDIEPEFRSRLSGGLITTINPPDLKTRTHIIRKKAGNSAIDLDDELINYLATQIKGDIRRVESAIVGLKAKSGLTGVRPNMDMVQEVLASILGCTNQQINAEFIRDFIAKQFKTSTHELRSKSRKKTITFPRQVAMYLARKMTDQALGDIGQAFNRDHSTVVHSIRVITDAVQRDGSVRGQIELLTDKLRQQCH